MGSKCPYPPSSRRSSGAPPISSGPTARSSHPSTRRPFDEAVLRRAARLHEDARSRGRPRRPRRLRSQRLALYDLVLASAPKLSTKDREATKTIARDLPIQLEKKLVIDWRKSQRARAAVRAAIKDALDVLPEAYTPEQYEKAVDAVYEHVFESYWGEGKSKYASA